MREIKFRAFDTKYNAYCSEVTGLSDFDVNDEYYWNDELYCEPWRMLNRIEADSVVGSGRIIVEQYTGLKDKNGVEIYEGDIISGDNVVYWRDSFSDFCFGYRFAKEKRYTRRLNLTKANITKCKLEVIGNIHKENV